MTTDDMTDAEQPDSLAAATARFHERMAPFVIGPSDGRRLDYAIIDERHEHRPDWQVDPTVRIHPSARINVTERLVIGAYSVIHENVIIEGRDIEIGQEAWILPGAIIGGGSCFERQSSLRAGHFLHMGRDSFINTARPVTIGDEVGLGTGTKLYTHGAYLSALDGFPVAFAPISIADHVWLPNAIVNPGVHIGSDVVVGVGSVVTRDIPPGSLAGGIPAKVLREGAYPAPLSPRERMEFWERFIAEYPEPDAVIGYNEGMILVGGASFLPLTKRITGPVTEASERMRDQLRRYGIRFWSRPGPQGQYVDWGERQGGKMRAPGTSR